MDCDLPSFDFLCGAFPEVDIRVIKATVLEHGDDVESAFSFLNGIINEGKDASSVQDERESCLPHRNPSRVDSSALATELEIAVCDDYIVSELSSSNASSRNEVSLASLEDIVEEAKSDKELVINLVKEISNLRAKADQESIAALRAKSEAATSGECLLKKAGEVRKEISRKKQDNLLRMGEIYGEKAVLTTEERELKIRLKQVKLQKERAIKTLNEIQVSLQGFYDAAVEEKKKAEEDGRMKVEIAQKILADEAARMATVEEESKKLDMEAEACVQLKESLAQYGSLVDSLQGEMSILTEDVESFKRQVEEGMWSSVSTASLSSNVNPEGPYTFRRCNLASTASSQDLGQSFEALYSSRPSHGRTHALASQDLGQSLPSNATPEGSYTFMCKLPSAPSSLGSEQSFEALDSSRQPNHKMSISSSHEKPDSLSGHSNASSQDLGKEFHCLSHVKEDVEWHHELAKSGSLSRGSREDFTSNIMFSATSSDGGGIQSFIDSTEMVATSPTLYGGNHCPGMMRSQASLNGIAESGHEFINRLDNTYRALKRVDSERAGDEWVITTKQFMDSRSSSSSSMVKVEADDYCSD